MPLFSCSETVSTFIDAGAFSPRFTIDNLPSVMTVVFTIALLSLDTEGAFLVEVVGVVATVVAEVSTEDCCICSAEFIAGEFVAVCALAAAAFSASVKVFIVIFSAGVLPPSCFLPTLCKTSSRVVVAVCVTV